MKNILITGASGFLGGNLLSLSPFPKTYGTYNKNPLSNKNNQTYQLDLSHQNEVLNLITNLEPNIIIHTAALSKPEICEENKEQAWEVNVEGTKNLIKNAEKLNSRLIYISTDLVFNGEKGWYSEEDHPNTISYYAETKLKAEEEVKENCSNYCILRTSLIYGMSLNNSKCFTEIFLRKLIKNKEVQLFVDEFRTPIYVKDLCKYIFEFTENDTLQGIFHLAGNERVSRYEFGLLAAKIFQLNKNLINPIKSKNIKTIARRAKDVSLINKKAKKELHKNFRDIKDCLKDFREEIYA